MRALAEDVAVIASKAAISDRRPAERGAEPLGAGRDLRLVAGQREIEEEVVVTKFAAGRRLDSTDVAAKSGVKSRSADGRVVSGTSFLRCVDLPFATVATALEAWWERDQRGGTVAVDRHTQMGRINVDSGVGRVRIVICRGWGPLRSSVPMELELAPRYERQPVTRLELIARRRVHASERYFRIGHEVLDTLIAQIASERASERASELRVIQRDPPPRPRATPPRESPCPLSPSPA
jgi:hypothetical protein